MNPLAILRDLVDYYFSKPEFRLLCFDLGFDYDNIRGETKIEKIQEFIILCQQHNKSRTLDERLKELRQHANWPKTANHPLIDTIEQQEQSYQPIQEKNLEILIDKDDVNGINESQENLESITSNGDLTQISQEKVVHIENSTSFLNDAEMFAQIAKDHFYDQQPVQSHAFARKAAKQFLKANNKLEAVKQYIFAAEVYLQKTFFHLGMASGDIDQALKLVEEIQNPYLKAKTLLLKVQVSLFIGHAGDTEKLWNEINTLLPDIKINSYKIACEMALQKASVARLDGNLQETLTVLETENKKYNSGDSNSARLDLLWSLLFLYSELGNWNAVQRTYETASEILNSIEDPVLLGRWLAHYASSLARSGQLEKALETYDEALRLLENSNATSKQKHHFYQNMMFVLNRNGGLELFGSRLKYESRRLDLMLNARNENVGYEYITKAKASQFEENNSKKAFLEASVAFMIAWREGDWSLLNQAHDTFSKLHFLAEEYVDALITAIYTEHGKEIPKLAQQVLNIRDSTELNRLFDELIREWPTWPDQANALMALGKCVDVLPPNREAELLSFLMQILENSHQQELKSKVYLHAIASLNELTPRLQEDQLDEVLHVCLSLVPNSDSYNLRQEILNLIAKIFFSRNQTDAPSLEQELFNILQSFCEIETFKSDAEFALAGLAKNSSANIRNKVVRYFSQKEDTHFLAFLGEEVPEEKIRSHLEKVLKANTPHRDEKGSISYSGINTRGINNFNDILPPSLYDFTIDGLLNVITNPDGFLSQKSSAIMTLRWLPDAVLTDHAEEISETLLSIFEEDLTTSSGFLNWFGSVEEIRRNALYTLGRIYAFTSQSIQKNIRDTIIVAATDKLSPIRLGSAMSLRVFEHPSSFSNEMTYTLIELTHDEDPQVREWAYSAAGHRIADNSISNNAPEFLIERLMRAAREESATNARAGAAYALKILNKRDDLAKNSRERIQTALTEALNDVNYQVRKMASDAS